MIEEFEFVVENLRQYWTGQLQDMTGAEMVFRFEDEAGADGCVAPDRTIEAAWNIAVYNGEKEPWESFLPVETFKIECCDQRG